MIQMDQNRSLKWIEMERNIPTRVQFTKFNQNRKNPVTQIEPKWSKMDQMDQMEWTKMSHQKELKWTEIYQQEPS